MHPPLLAVLSPTTLQAKKTLGYVLRKWAGHAGLFTSVVILVKEVKPESSCKNRCFCAWTRNFCAGDWRLPTKYDVVSEQYND